MVFDLKFKCFRCSGGDAPSLIKPINSTNEIVSAEKSYLDEAIYNLIELKGFSGK